MKNKIAILGPEHTYCHILAKKLFPNNDFILCNTIEEIFIQVQAGNAESGLAPIENMIHGTVRDSLLALIKYQLKINHSFDLPIHNCLASKTKKFKKIISHTQPIGQCSTFLEFYRNKGIKIEETTSTAKAMEIASLDSEYAAIGSEEAASSYNLNILYKNIENNHDNITRFILISKNESKISEKSRTSIIISPQKDKPGLLYELLSVFKKENVNLTKIESIPSGNKLGEYSFFIEFEGSLIDSKIKMIITELNKNNKIISFGSYLLN